MFLLLILRLMYVLFWIAICITVATLWSLHITVKHPDPHGDTWHWLGDVLLSVLPSTLLLTEIGLLITHWTVNSIAGYTSGILLWISNFVISQILHASNQKLEVVHWLLFGWYDRLHTEVPADWWKYKLGIGIIALVLHFFHLFLLGNHARMLRNFEE